MLKIVTQKQVDLWQFIENDYDKKCNQCHVLKNEKEDAQKFLETLASKLEGTGATVCAIKQNKEGTNTFVCVIDERKPEENYRDGKIYLSGNVNIFVLNQNIYPTQIPGKYNDMPFLEASFHGPDVKMIELHSDIRGDYYENHGYGTMLVDALVAIARKADCDNIHGMLSDVDAQTEIAKEKRNGFYRKRGFTLRFNDATEKDGSVILKL